MVVRLYPSINSLSGRLRKRGIYATGRGDHISGRVGSFNERGRVIGREGRGGQGKGGYGQEGRGGGSGAYENGIDISDVTRYFEDSEWASL